MENLGFDKYSIGRYQEGMTGVDKYIIVIMNNSQFIWVYFLSMGRN